MADKRYYKLSSSDAAIRLELISKAQGLEQAKNYFNNLSNSLKSVQVYGALLSCYATAQWVEKAEAIMDKMRDFGAKKTMNYNSMLNLYCKTAQIEKLEGLLQEMEDKGVVRDIYTYGIQLTAYAAVMNIEGIDKVVELIKSDPNIVPNLINYTAAATGYSKAGLLDKAFEMLNKAEACLARTSDLNGYCYLLTHYASIGEG